MSQASTSIKSVQAFWDANPCGSRSSQNADRSEYFSEIEARRYSHESHIPKVARFGEFCGKRVLEIGDGIGTDGLQFQTNGADYVGIDLTPSGQALAREQFVLAGHGGKLIVG